MRRLRFRWIVVGIILAVGLYFVVDIVALQYLESRGGAELARAMAAESATVDLGGPPFLPSFIAGRLASAEFDVRGASGSGGLRVQALRTRLTDLRFGWRKVFALARSSFATRTRVRATDPVGIVELGEDDLEEFIRRHLPAVGDVQVAATGIEVRFIVERPRDEDDEEEESEGEREELSPPARFLPRIEDRRIVLSLVGVAEVPPALRSAAERIEGLIDLPRVPEGLRTDVRLGDGVVIIEASGPELELEIGEGEP